MHGSLRYAQGLRQRYHRPKPCHRHDPEPFRTRRYERRDQADQRMYGLRSLQGDLSKGHRHRSVPHRDEKDTFQAGRHTSRLSRLLAERLCFRGIGKGFSFPYAQRRILRIYVLPRMPDRRFRSKIREHELRTAPFPLSRHFVASRMLRSSDQMDGRRRRNGEGSRKDQTVLGKGRTSGHSHRMPLVS